MAMARMKRSFGTRDLPTYQRSDTLEKYLAQSPVSQDAAEDGNSMQQVIQQQMQQMMEQKLTTDSSKQDLSEAPWAGPLDPMGD